MSADPRSPGPPSPGPPAPGPPSPAQPEGERLPEGVSGVDLARAALADARAAARQRARTPGKGARRAVERRSGDARDPQLVADAISGLIADQGWEIPTAVGNALDRWA